MLCLQKQGAQLLAAQCCREAVGEEGEVGDERVRLSFGVVLAHRHEKDLLAQEKL